MQFLIVLLLACVVFAFCFAVFLLKGRKGETEPRLHGCGQGDDCHCQADTGAKAICDHAPDNCCHGKSADQNDFDLLELLEKAKRKDDTV